MWIFAKTWFYGTAAIFLVSGYLFFNQEPTNLLKGTLFLIVGVVVLLLTIYVEKVPGYHYYKTAVK